MRKQLKQRVWALCLLFSSVAHGAGTFSVPLPDEGAEFEYVQEQLSSRSLTLELLESQQLLPKHRAVAVSQGWLTEVTGNPALDTYVRERENRSEISRVLAELRGYVDFEQDQGVDDMIDSIYLQLQQDQAGFYIPVYLYSKVALPFLEEGRRSELLQTSRARFVTREYGLEQLFSVQESTLTDLTVDRTRISTSGRLELDSSLASCQFRDLETSTSVALEVTRHRFYPFAPDRRRHLEGTFVREGGVSSDYEVQVHDLPVGKLGLDLGESCQGFLEQLYVMQVPEDHGDAQKVLTQLLTGFDRQGSALVSAVRQVMLNELAEGCATLNCVASRLNQPVEAPDDWPKLLVLQVETEHRQTEAGLFFALGFELVDELISHLKTIRTSVDEQLSDEQYSLEQTQQLEMARVGKLELLPYAGDGETLGVFVRAELLAPSSAIPTKEVLVGEHTLVFREVFIQNEPYWVMEQSVSAEVMEAFLGDYQQHRNSLISRGCQLRDDFASCLNSDGLRWFLQWVNDQAVEQLVYPQCERWYGYLESLDSAASCGSGDVFLEGLCTGVKDACNAPGGAYFSIGNCDSCGPPRINSRYSRFLPNSDNGLRLIIQ